MRFGDIARLNDEGAYHIQGMFKTGGPASFGAARWADMSMGAGNPKYNAYVGGQAAFTPLIGSGNDGIFTGAAQPGKRKVLWSWTPNSVSVTAGAKTYMLLDYLGFYALIDGDDTDVQIMDNTQGLTRHVLGEGVQCMIVCTTPMVADAVCILTYRNSKGVSGRQVTFRLLASTVVGCMVTALQGSTQAIPFVPLANGDSGIQAIEDIRCVTGAGGFFAAVLVKPITTRIQYLPLYPVDFCEPEKRGHAEVLEDGHYLNVICHLDTNGTVLPFQSLFEFNWV
jgi:hypothetical protein